MQQKFEVRVDVNRALEHPETRNFTKGILGAFMVIMISLTGLTIFQSLRGNHVKTPIFENIPNATIDTPKPNETVKPIDNSVHIDHVSGDVIIGKKTVINKK